MRQAGIMLRALAAFGIALTCAGFAYAQSDFVAIQGAQCAAPPVLHCPASECAGTMMINQGPVVEMKTRRPYFLDYPCDLKPGEQVTFVLSLHGGGSYGNWHRHYFPIMDYKEKYRLVVATPNTPTRQWDNTNGADDAYLQNIVDFVLGQLAQNKVQVKSFWLVGHSWGGVTSNRLLRTDFFKNKVDGFLSLSGGRIGGQPAGAGGFGPGASSSNARPAGAAAPARTTSESSAAPAGPGRAATAGAFAILASLPDADFSFIYATGRREMAEQGFPATSDWAKKYGCGEKARREDVADTVPGYVFDSSRLNTLNAAWGLLPAGGIAEIYEYPNCKDGRIVFDVARMNKGHTEGLEPQITQYLIELMLSAKGGKLMKSMPSS